MPQVSIIIPCYNEEKTIGLLLEAIHAQTYPAAQMEVVIADGMSTDGTRAEIAAFQAKHPDLAVHVIDNNARTIPAALNRAIEAAQGETIVRLDAHSVPHPDYVERSLGGLQAGKGANVGGVWEIKPRGAGWVAESIAIAAAHPLGVGDASYRYTDKAQSVDTVPFGAYRKDFALGIGGYDETLLSNEDYEFNTRVRQSGGVVWLDPQIRSTYFARPSFSALAKQYWRYGFWKVRMLRRYPETIRWRQALPPVFVLSLIVLGLAAPWLPLARLLFMLEVVSYSLILLAVGTQTAFKNRKPATMIGVPLAIATMHICWGGAFLWSLLTKK
ncbi:MAG: glycosyltransferase family 2 protein [Anaerolineales bacterium]|nr:glycosyltransferase family 2 protein [Anaerolineales bacterium]